MRFITVIPKNMGVPKNHVREVTIVFKKLCKKVPSMMPGQKGPPQLRQILFDVSGAIKPREVVALMVTSPPVSSSRLVVPYHATLTTHLPSTPLFASIFRLALSTGSIR